VRMRLRVSVRFWLLLRAARWCWEPVLSGGLAEIWSCGPYCRIRAMIESGAERETGRAPERHLCRDE
jgi:hypothetical protein